MHVSERRACAALGQHRSTQRKIPTTADDVDLVVNRTMSRVSALLDEAMADSKPLQDLGAEIVAAGYGYESFEHALRIDRSILDSLIFRLINPATLPAVLLSRIANALRQPDDRLREYFLRPPQIVAAYKNRSRRSIGQIDFAELVRQSNLPEPDKDRWISEPIDPGLRSHVHG